MGLGNKKSTLILDLSNRITMLSKKENHFCNPGATFIDKQIGITGAWGLIASLEQIRYFNEVLGLLNAIPWCEFVI